MNKSLIAFLFMCILTGCASLGSHVISNPDIFFPEAEQLGDELGFEKRSFCSSSTDVCIPYLIASPYVTSDFKKGETSYYELQAEGNGVVNTISQPIAPETFNRFKGTAVLLHGYGASKEAMWVTASYFRSLGMKTIIPDLFGHGESKEEFGFAAREHASFSELLTNLGSKEKLNFPILIVGHSMGALASIKLLQEHSEASGAILLAPMIRFDQAAEKYLPYKLPTISKLISNKVLSKSIEKALSDADVELADTDILNHIEQSTKPLLIINSDIDSISPSRYFSSITGDNIQLMEFKGRNHPSLTVFTQENAQLVEKWLFDNFFTEFENES